MKPSSDCPKVSICLPVYNGERYLAEAIKAALGQTFEDFELLIADDCSKDSSPEIIANFAARDGRIKHWRNAKNLGLFENYNETMRHATGQYIKLYAQDDLWEPTILAKLLDQLEKNPDVALVSCARRLVDENGQETNVLRERQGNTILSYEEVLKENLLDLKNYIGEPSTVLFPRDRIGSGFDKGFYHLGDIEYWFRLIGDRKYLYLDEVLCSFRTHNLSTTSKNAKGLRFALDMVKLGKSYRDFLATLGLNEEDYARMVAEATATHVKYLSRKGSVSLPDLLAVEHENVEAMVADFAGFKEVLFYALLIAGEALEENHALKREWEAERNKLENQIAMLMNSKSWRVTVPLRGAMKLLRK
jgi:glycosyltransferase involved in cell wall biosynthesis